MKKTRELWKSHFGFIWAAIGSAIGLGSIWRFPYILGQNGGAAFAFLFCFFLVFVSLPVLVAEIIIGRKVHKDPCGAFADIGKNKFWSGLGFMTVITGFLVSSFYSVICGWTLGYLLEALAGNLTNFQSIAASGSYFQKLVASPVWALATQFSFMFLSTIILYVGVQKGIEAGNKFLMPLLFAILLVLVGYGLTMPGAERALEFLFTPDWKSITPAVVVMALGQAFFGLSLGQGTMVTYGSYLSKKENILSTVIPIALAVIFVSLLAGIAIFTVVFSVDAKPTGGTNLMFQTLPMVFSRITGGNVLAIMFFLLILLAGLTSQISAMEPVISYLMDEKNFSRHKAVLIAGFSGFIIGIPSALSYGILSGYKIFGMNLFDMISSLCINILIPIGGLSAVILVGWKWGINGAFSHLKIGAERIFEKFPLVIKYLQFSIKYFSPVVIVFILLNILGLL